MLKQLLQNSYVILRRPSVKSFQKINVDKWQWAFVYLAIGTVLTTLIHIATNLFQGPAHEQQSLELTKRLGSSNFASLLNTLQNPFFTLATGILGFFFVILLWILLPYWLGQAFGGSKGFGSFAYNTSLFVTPITILDSLLALTLSNLLGGLFLFLSLSLDAFCFYLVFVNLQATMGLSKGKSALVIFIPIILAIFLFCGLFIFLMITALSR